MIDAGKIVSYLELDATGYRATLEAAWTQLQTLGDSSLSASERVDALGGALGLLGSSLNRNVTLPLAAAGTAVTASAVNFETAFAGVRKTVDATEGEYEELAQGLMAMSEEIPASASKLAGLMEIAGQLGVDRENLLSFTETVANLGVTTNLTGEAAATMLAQYANVMQMPLSEIGNLGSVIVALGNSCATTEADIAAMAQRLAGTGNLVELSNAEVIGLAATMASLGINAEAGGSAMSRVLQDMNSAVLGNGGALEDYAQAAGVSAEEFVRLWQGGPLEALDALLAGLRQISDEGGDASGALDDLGLSDIRISDTLLRMSGAQGELAANIELANSAWAENSALQKEAGERYATTESKLQTAKNSVNNMMTALGKGMLPVVTEVAGVVGDLADDFSSLDEEQQKNIVTMGLAAAAAGPVLTILGKGVSLLSGPGGWAALLVAAGVAGAAALNQMKEAAIEADLESRFGDVTLSAGELNQALEAMLGRSTGYTESWAVAVEETSKAVEDMKTSAGELDRLVIKAGLGIEVDPDELTTAAQGVRTSVTTAIEAERIKANLAVDTLFEPGDMDGTLLAGRIGGYFGELEGEAKTLGQELAAAVEAGMADGFLDENEQATIQALRDQLESILQQVADIESGSQLYRWRNQVNTGTLSAQSVMDLLEGSNAIYEGGLKEKQEARDYLKNLLSQDAAEGGWAQARYDAEAAVIDQQYEESARQWAAEVAQSQWDALGASIRSAYEQEFGKAESFIAEAKQGAAEATDRWLRDYMGLEAGDEGYAEAWAARFREVLQNNFAFGWGDVIAPTAQAGLQEIYAAMLPTHETVRELAQAMGEEFPQELQSVLDEMNILEMLISDPANAGYNFVQNLDVDAFREAGESAGQEAVGGMEKGSAGAEETGQNTGRGYAQGMRAEIGNVRAAGAALGHAGLAGYRQATDQHSPSRLARRDGGYMGQGYVLGMLDEKDSVWAAGAALGETSIEALATAIDAHSPADETKKQGLNYVLGFVEGIADRVGQSALGKVVATAVDYAGEVWDNAVETVRQQQTSSEASASSARKKAAAKAEAERQQAVLDGIQQTAAATLKADQAAYSSRMAALESQTASLMAFAGSHAIWYQDDKGKTAVEEAKARYAKEIEAEISRYEAQLAQLTTDAQREAAKAAYDERIELLKEQQAAEVEALKEQYDLQKEMATDWLSYQQSLLSAELSAKRAAYAEEDYEDELAALKKQQRQSKSAREKRELQEQIDRMERDHALEMEEAALQETLAGYNALIEAVNAGLIGMGDLTGNSAFGDLSFGTAGLSALDNLTAKQLEAVLGSLSQSALSDGTGATVSAAQMAAALQSASYAGMAVESREGSHYTIDLRGATVRDDSDIDRIVAELDRRLREAGR